MFKSSLRVIFWAVQHPQGWDRRSNLSWLEEFWQQKEQKQK